MLLLSAVLPEFTRELEGLLAIQGRSDLAQQLSSAKIVQRCTCHDDFCASFYLKPGPEGAYPPGFETLDLEAEQGMVLVDVVKGELAHIEVLYRDDVRKQLDRCF